MLTRRIGATFAATALCMLPIGVAAHARWFTPPGPWDVPDWSRLWSLPVLVALVVALGAVALLWRLQRLLGDPLWPRPPFLQRLEPSAAAILGVQTAITMIFFATRLQLFVPSIQLPANAFGAIVALVTIAAAFTFITGMLTRIGAFVTIGLVLLAFGFTLPSEVFELAVYVGIALYLMAVGRGVVRYSEDAEEGDSAPLTDWLLPRALDILRIGVGISVLMSAFTEKLVGTALGMEFLATHPAFNVGRDLGIGWFTDERFVSTIGVIEATAGVALLAGFLPRVVILVLWIPFNLGIPFLPAEELIGHLPILSTMYVLLVRGTEGVPPRIRALPQTSEPFPPQRLTDEIEPATPGLASAPAESG
ncbi:MAG: hypothetical protein IT337_07280 [Thermomicrobiales bacterium]|nr:hypothetical protein [Thermomicrobiales bacterium]